MEFLVVGIVGSGVGELFGFLFVFLFSWGWRGGDFVFFSLFFSAYVLFNVTFIFISESNKK